jgi:hypothetical protein
MIGLGRAGHQELSDAGGAAAQDTERVCCLSVLNSVTSTLQWIRQPKPRDADLLKKGGRVVYSTCSRHTQLVWSNIVDRQGNLQSLLLLCDGVSRVAVEKFSKVFRDFLYQVYKGSDL